MLRPAPDQPIVCSLWSLGGVGGLISSREGRQLLCLHHLMKVLSSMKFDHFGAPAWYFHFAVAA